LIPEGFKEQDPQPAKWFHVINTPEYRVEEVDNLWTGNTMGYCCTDSFGMVCHIILSNNIEAHQLSGNWSSGHTDRGPV
jgi:hypothetical protein